MLIPDKKNCYFEKDSIPFSFSVDILLVEKALKVFIDNLLFKEENTLDKEIINDVSTIEDESVDFYRKLVLGQQVYNAVVYAYLFSKVIQNSKQCGHLVRSIPKEDVLLGYLRELGFSSICESIKHGLRYKIRKGFVVMGIHYQKDGYDHVLSTIQSVFESDLADFFDMPITNYTHLLESYARNKLHKRISYTVKTKARYSDKDIIISASSFYQGNHYYATGYSKKNAIERLSKIIVNNAIPDEERKSVAISQNYVPIEKHSLQIESTDYIESDDLAAQFADKYGVDHLLMRLALLSRSQMGGKLWDRLGINQPEAINTRVSRWKRGIINWGQELLLLQLLDFNLKAHNFNSVDMSSFDIMNSTFSPEDIHAQLIKILRLDEFRNVLHDEMQIPINDSLTDRDKIQIGNGIVAVFFLSNFSPDKKFFQFFVDSVEKFYSDKKLNLETDYRFALIAHLSVFGIRAETNNYEAGNEVFHAEIVIGNGKNPITFVCEDASMRYAKKEVWHIAYESMVCAVQRFFTEGVVADSEDAIRFFITKTGSVQIHSVSFFSGYGFLNGDSIPKLNIDLFDSVFQKAKQLSDAKGYKAFIETVCRLNAEKYLIIENTVYEYGEWLKYRLWGTKPKHVISDSELPAVYDFIVNPSPDLQRRIISVDYKQIQRIFPLSDTLAFYAIEQNLDAYNYLSVTSPAVTAYYEKLKAEQKEYSDIGILDGVVSESVSISIMDSQKPFHSQIRKLISNLDIKRIMIACGYCFSSGLSMLRDVFEHSLLSGIQFELYVGSLQNYDETNPDSIITGIDKKTVRELNHYLSFSNFSLFTCPDRFYHGKLYIFEGEIDSVVVMGSSNISRSAFVSNYELNIAFTLKNEAVVRANFVSWLKQLQYYSKRIDSLDENLFGNNEIKLDGSVLLKCISISSMQSRIQQLTNAEVQYRLNLWMSYSPDIIAEDLGILSLPNYFVFVYNDIGLIVLESFEAGNAYFCIKSGDSFENTINNISTFSKSEIFEYSKMEKRGYHIQNKFTLENNIRWYFRRNHK